MGLKGGKLAFVTFEVPSEITVLTDHVGSDLTGNMSICLQDTTTL